MLYLYIMGIQKSNKINSLLNSWPYGTIAVSSWLKKQGVSAQLAAVYKKSGWIESVAHGAFVHAGDKVSWSGGLFALQEEMGLVVHAGGRTALQLHGSAHFLPLSADHPVFLFGLRRTLPNWFIKYSWGMTVCNVYTHCFPYKERTGLTERKMEAYSVWLSTPELAMLEVLYLVGRRESYQNAFLLMEGLNTLRPDLVQELLEKCSSVKVKRLFMHLAEQFKHPWLQYVNVDKINFGKGKRVVEAGGYFDSKYDLSVPGASSKDKQWT